MSRSRKKTGVIKDTGRFSRREYNRLFRRVNKQRVQMGERPYLMKELVNDYDVHDYISRWHERSERAYFARYDFWLHDRGYTLDDYRRMFFKK